MAKDALGLLLEARSRPGVPHVDPSVALDVEQQWPATGLGGREALARLAGSALEHVSRLAHPGFFAHMDPPTRG